MDRGDRPQGPRRGVDNYRRNDDRSRYSDQRRTNGDSYRSNRDYNSRSDDHYLRADRRAPGRRDDREDRGYSRDRDDMGYSRGNRDDRGYSRYRSDDREPSRRNDYRRPTHPSHGGKDDLHRKPEDRGDPRASRRDTRAPNREEDLSSVISLDKMARPNPSKWDVTAEGFEKVPAERAKLVGLFQKPGSKKIHVDYNKVLSLINNSGEFFSSDSNENMLESSEINLADARKSKIVIISNVNSEEVQPELVTQFINNYIITLDIEDHQGKDNVISNYKLHEDALIIELINSAVTTIAVTLNGQFLPNQHNVKLLIARPGNYIAQAALADITGKSEKIEDNCEKIALTNIPKEKTDKELQEEVERTTETTLSGLKVLKNQLTQESSGTAFLRFSEPKLTQIAIDKLNGYKYENNELKCFRACDSTLKQETPLTYPNMPEAVIGKITPMCPASTVVQFLNCIDIKDFANDTIYEGIKKDFKDQCSKCGDVVEVVIPKPADVHQVSILHSEPGVGRVFVKFATVEGSRLAVMKLSGYVFGERTVLASFFNEQDYNLQLW